MSSLTPIVRFHLEYPFHLTGRRKLKEDIKMLFELEHKSLSSLDYIFCSDDYLLRINQDYLHHDTLTDIITFDLSAHADRIAGEIYISIERIIENARLFQVPRQTELKRVMFHGALHLCGYADKKPADKIRMTRKEDFYLKRST